ncbi:glycosyltransferase family 4 protein [Chloroflexota bacterium]
MKVILLCRSIYPFHGYGGIEKYPYYLGKNLIAEGIEVEIVASLPGNGKRYEVYENIKYTFLPPRVTGKKFIGLWQMLFNVNAARYLKKQEFDILQSNIPPTAYLVCRNRKPVIVQPFGLEPFTLRSFLDKKGLKRLYLDLTSRRQWQYGFSNAEAVAAEEDFQIDFMVNLGIPREKIVIFPLGVDIPLIKGRFKSRQVSRKALGINDDDPVLISVNKFIPEKGINYLVEAFFLIRQKLMNCKLILAGGVNNEQEKAYYQDIRELIRKHGLVNSIICLKNVPEESLYDYYNIADVYVSPTLYDDIIMSIQEAMVVGLPVVSTGQRFLVQEGVNGLIVPMRDPRAMAEAVVKILYNRKQMQQMGKASIKIVSRYDWGKVAKKAIGEYKRIIESS